MKFKRAIFTALVMLIMVIPNMALAVSRNDILAIGDKDEYVKELQLKLKELGYLTCNATGYYGTLTQAAVIEFQKDKGLKVDGKAGPQTRGELFSDDYKQIENDRQTLDENSKDKYVVGDKGDEVIKIQTRLKMLEYYDYGEITGYYGPVTQTAVKRFQTTNKLMIDGVVGNQTYEKLFSDDAKYFTLYPEDRGEDVVKVQKTLKSLGYYKYSSATGYYGSITVSAVRDFQKDNGLVADGVAGKNTRALLYSGNASVNDNLDSSDDLDAVEAINITDTVSKKADEMIEFAKTLIGLPYRISSEGPTSFDCSGFVYYVMKNSGLNVSRYSSSAYATQESWDKISKISDLKKGDLMFFRSSYSSSISHVGIYIGDGKLIHASSSKREITITNVAGYFTDNFVLGRRVLD